MFLPFSSMLIKDQICSFCSRDFSGQVAAVVFTEDLKRIYVTMKEGFPLEYVVS